MAKSSIDLTSKEWRDLVFADKNRDFGAYVMRQQSDKRHNKAFLFLIIGLIVVIAMIIAWSKYTDYDVVSLLVL